jgi:hypothetical protein
VSAHPAAHGFVEPAYGARSLGDVLPAVAHALGVGHAFADERPTDLLLPDAPAYVVLLVDGLGHELLRAHPEDAPFLHELLLASTPATAGVPSTTATSLTSLGTALTPGHHGVLGYTTRVPGTDKLLNALQWSKSVDPSEWQPHPTAFARLAAAGVDARAVNKREFADSGLTRVSTRGAEYVGADLVGERLVAAVEGSAGAGPSLTYLYDPDLDWTGHRYGVDSAQWRAELEAIDTSALQLREMLDPATRLVVVADHGMVDPPEESRIEVDDVPGLRDGVALLGGEARFRHLYCRAGAVDDVAATWRSVLGERAEVLTRDEAFARGWFGRETPLARPRVGDVVAACTGDTAILSKADFPVEPRLVGMHGSLTAAEMLVPVLVA